MRKAAGALQMTQNSPLPQREAVDRQWNSLVDVLDLMTDFYPERALNAREWSSCSGWPFPASIWARCQIPWIMSSWREATGCGCKAPGPSLSLASMRAFSRPMGPRQGFFHPEREELNARGAELPVLGTESTLREQFVLYSALSAAAERLTITYARQNIAGDAQLAPAGYLLRVLRPLRVSPIRTEAFPAEFWVVNEATAKADTRRLWAGTPRRRPCWPPCWSCWERGGLSGCDETGGHGRPGRGYHPGKRPAAAGPGAEAGPTAIDRYYQCPYQFFCDKMLRLRPRQRVEFSPFESGSAIHYVFQQMVNQYGSRGLCELTDEEMDGRSAASLREYIDRMVPDPTTVTARFRYQFDRLRLMLGIIVRHLADEFSQSEFTAAATEVSVGEGEVASPAAERRGRHPISLRGSIDRVDLTTARRETTCGSSITNPAPRNSSLRKCPMDSICRCSSTCTPPAAMRTTALAARSRRGCCTCPAAWRRWRSPWIPPAKAWRPR